MHDGHIYITATTQCAAMSGDFRSTNEMKDRTHDQDLDMLSTYDQDGLHQLAFVAREMLVELESENRFLR